MNITVDDCKVAALDIEITENGVKCNEVSFLVADTEDQGAMIGAALNIHMTIEEQIEWYRRFKTINGTKVSEEYCRDIMVGAREFNRIIQ